MRSLIVAAALLSTAFLVGCQDMVQPDEAGQPLFSHGPPANPGSPINGTFRVTATFGDVGIGPPLFTNAEACDFGYERTQGTIKITELHGETIVTIKIKHAVPEEFHTVWLRLVGFSPLTGLPFTPLVPQSGLNVLALVTPPNPGQTYSLSGFQTDGRGKGKVTIRLDFSLSAGVYPFPSGDVPIAVEPFTIAIASHCVDHVGHGLVPGPHENTQQWR